MLDKVKKHPHSSQRESSKSQEALLLDYKNSGQSGMYLMVKSQGRTKLHLPKGKDIEVDTALNYWFETTVTSRGRN